MTEPVVLWDEEQMISRLMKAVTGLPRVRLSLTGTASSHPGIYLQWFATRKVEAMLGELVATGRYPAYVGVAASLRERMGRYRRRAAELVELDPDEIFVSMLPLSTVASAKFAEAALIALLEPPLQGSGWGAKPPGRHRREQSPIDALLEGRHWASPPSHRAQAAARLQLLARLIQLGPAGPRWQPLVP